MSTISITLGTNEISVIDDGGNAPETVIPKSEISDVSGIFIANPVRNKSEGFPFDTVTELVIRAGSKEYKYELQNVSNQAAWSTGLKSGLDAAINAIQASL